MPNIYESTFRRDDGNSTFNEAQSTTTDAARTQFPFSALYRIIWPLKKAFSDNAAGLLVKRKHWRAITTTRIAAGRQLVLTGVAHRFILQIGTYLHWFVTRSRAPNSFRCR